MRTAPALAAAAVLAAVGCSQQQPEPPAGTVAEWVQPSPDGRFELRQRRDGAGCRVQSVVKSGDGERTLWTTQNCLPTPSGMAFLSPNGEKALVLDLFPSSQQAATPDWSRLPLVSLWIRGAVVRQYSGAEILGEARASDMRRVLSWVRGDTLEEAHQSARASADGERVSIVLVDGRTLAVGFDGAALPVAPALPARPAARQDDEGGVRPPSPGTQARGDELPSVDRGAVPADALAADDQGVYRWEDDQGALHFGAGAQVPAKYRKRARPVDATIGVVPLEPHASAPTPARAGTAPGGAAAAGQPAPGAAAPAAGGATPNPGSAVQPPPPPPSEPITPPPGTR